MTEPVSDKTHTEALELQKLLAADLVFYKSQQWQVTNYCLLLQAALAGATRFFHPQRLETFEYVVLLAISGAILVAGVRVILEFERAVKLRQGLFPAARRLFTDEGLRAYGPDGDVAHALRPANEKVSFMWLFISAHTVSFILVAWVIVRSAYACEQG